MSDVTEIVERVTRAIVGADPDGDDVQYEQWPEHWKAAWRGRAQAAIAAHLSALSEAGYVVVPKDMNGVAVVKWLNEQGCVPISFARFNFLESAEADRSRLAASPSQQAEKGK